MPRAGTLHCRALRIAPEGKPVSPILWPAYQGSNPISDVWAMDALQECARFLPRMAGDPSGDDEARSGMCLAASAAGMGFGNAGVHICHGMSYALASQVDGGYWTEGYPRPPGDDGEGAGGHGLVAHGLSVAISAPSVFRFTGTPGHAEGSMAERYSQDRHVECAAILADARMRRQADASAVVAPSEKAVRDRPGEALADELLELMDLLNVPVGIRSLGYDESHIDGHVAPASHDEAVTRQPVKLKELWGLLRDALDG